MSKVTEMKVYPLKKSHPKVKANGSFVYDDVLHINFTLFQGPEGLFVGFPGKYGEKVNPETGKKPFYCDVRPVKSEVGDELRKEIEEQALSIYNRMTGDLSQGEAEGPSDQTRTNLPAF